MGMYYGWYGEGVNKRCIRYNTDANGNVTSWTTVGNLNCMRTQGGGRGLPKSLNVVSKDPQEHTGFDLGEFDHVTIGEKNPQYLDPNLEEKTTSAENRFLLIAAIVGAGLLGLVFLFKK